MSFFAGAAHDLLGRGADHRRYAGLPHRAGTRGRLRLRGRRADDPRSPSPGSRGSSSAGPPSGRQLRIADRAEWIDFNIEGFGQLMEPVVQRAAAGAGDFTWAVGGVTLTAQVGLLLGFLSSRVLGQYDTGPLLTPRKAEEPGKVFFLDGNIVSAAGRLGVPVDGLAALDRAARDDPRAPVRGLSLAAQAPRGASREPDLTARREARPARDPAAALENLRTGGRSVELLMTAPSASPSTGCRPRCP